MSGGRRGAGRRQGWLEWSDLVLLGGRGDDPLLQDGGASVNLLAWILVMQSLSAPVAGSDETRGRGQAEATRYVRPTAVLALPFSHFWTLRVMAALRSEATRCSSLRAWRVARAATWTYLLKLSSAVQVVFGRSRGACRDGRGERRARARGWVGGAQHGTGTQAGECRRFARHHKVS